MFSVHSKPNGQNQTADSQITTTSERRQRHTAYGGPRGGDRSFATRERAAAHGARHFKKVDRDLCWSSLPVALPVWQIVSLILPHESHILKTLELAYVCDAF
jgi:hypothetical protein